MFRKIKHWLDYSPPGSLSSTGWSLFVEEFKEKAPVRYWCKYSFYYGCIFKIKIKFERISDWIRYRTYDRYHIVRMGLEPGYYEVRTQILHVNFNLLKDFVEVEQAWQTYCFSSELTFGEKYIPLYKHIVPFRKPELGLKHFRWAATLDDPTLPPMEQSPHQAQAAREVLDLYDWWVNRRPNRFEDSSPDYRQYQKDMEYNSALEEEWNNEDNAMLIRLMNIRLSLWT